MNVIVGSQSLEEFLDTNLVPIQNSNKTSIRIPLSMHIVLEQVHDPEVNLLRFYTGVLQFGTETLQKLYGVMLQVNRELWQKTKNYAIDVEDYDTERVFGGNWKPTTREKNNYHIGIKPHDSLNSTIQTFRTVIGADTAWVYRCCVAQSLLLSEYINDTNTEKSIWSKSLGVYVDHFEQRIRYKNRALAWWIRKQEKRMKGEPVLDDDFDFIM